MLIYWALVLITTIHSSFEINISSPLQGETGMVCDMERTDEQSYVCCGILIDDFSPQFAIFDLRTDTSPPTPEWDVCSQWKYLQKYDSFITQGAMALDVCDPGIIPNIFSCGQIQDISVHSSGIHITQSGPYEDFSLDYSHGDWVSSLLYDIIYLEQDNLWVSCGEYQQLTGPAEPCGCILVGNTDGVIQHEILEDNPGTWQSIEYDSEVDLVLLGGHIPIEDLEYEVRFGIFNHLTYELFETSEMNSCEIHKSVLVQPIDNDDDRDKCFAYQISNAFSGSGMVPENAILISLCSYNYSRPYNPAIEQMELFAGGFFGNRTGYLSVIAAEEVQGATENTIEFRVLITGVECDMMGMPLEYLLFICNLEINIERMSIDLSILDDDSDPISTDDFIPTDFIFDNEYTFDGTGCGSCALFSLGEISLFTLSESPEVPSISRVSSTSSSPLDISVINHSTDGFPSIRISNGYDSRVNLKVYDITGRIVTSRAVDVPYYAELSWAELVGEQTGLASGIYLISADDNDSGSMATAKILLY